MKKIFKRFLKKNASPLISQNYLSILFNFKIYMSSEKESKANDLTNFYLIIDVTKKPKHIIRDKTSL